MRFNTKKPSTKTVNLAGGKAFKETAKLELASILATTFLKDGFYRSADDTIALIQVLMSQIPDQKFAAKAALWARHKHGIRSASHLVAAEIGKNVKGAEWTKSFFNKVVRRPDDVTEILACYMSLHGKPIPNSMKKGLAEAVNRFDEYSLAKYHGEGSDLSMVDAVNLIRPKATEALNKLMHGQLKNVDTWESRMSAAGTSEEETSNTTKAEVWHSLLKEGKLGYMALLRNLRNMLDADLQSVDIGRLCEQLENESHIYGSLVLPFRFLSAFKAIRGHLSPYTTKVIKSLAIASETSLKNVPYFDGDTCIMLDVSGSMTSATTRDLPVFQVAAMFAAVLAKHNNADVILFDENGRYANLNTQDSLFTITERLSQLFTGGGTNLQAAFEAMKGSGKKYDRIVILSDMQAWMDGGRPQVKFQHIETGEVFKPKIFSFDLAGLGSLQFPEKNIFCLAGWSDKSLSIMKALDKDQDAMVKEIEETVI